MSFTSAVFLIIFFSGMYSVFISYEKGIQEYISVYMFDALLFLVRIKIFNFNFGVSNVCIFIWNID